MTLEQAKSIAAMFREIGGFTDVKIEMFGFNSNVYRVHLWAVNTKAGNRNLTTIRTAEEVPDMQAAKRIARAAKGKATESDKKAIARIAAERSA